MSNRSSSKIKYYGKHLKTDDCHYLDGKCKCKKIDDCKYLDNSRWNKEKAAAAIQLSMQTHKDNAARTQVTLTKDKAFWELQQINETINQIEDTAELTSVMARVKELEKILK